MAIAQILFLDRNHISLLYIKMVTRHSLENKCMPFQWIPELGVGKSARPSLNQWIHSTSMIYSFHLRFPWWIPRSNSHVHLVHLRCWAQVAVSMSFAPHQGGRSEALCHGLQEGLWYLQPSRESAGWEMLGGCLRVLGAFGSNREKIFSIVHAGDDPCFLACVNCQAIWFFVHPSLLMLTIPYYTRLYLCPCSWAFVPASRSRPANKIVFINMPPVFTTSSGRSQVDHHEPLTSFQKAP